MSRNQPSGTFARRCAAAAMLAYLFACYAAPLAAQTAKQWSTQRMLMVETDVAAAGVKSPGVLAAMRTTPRQEFVPADMRPYAYMDMPLPIGYRQTISPPFIVASMTQQLDPRPTDRVLEIGTGSGYQAAVLAGVVKEVYTIEIEPALADRAAEVFKRLNYHTIHYKTGDGYLGWAEHAPFDKIIVTCSPEKIPRPLVEQLREGGRMVIPIGERFQQTLYTMRKERGQLVVESREPTFFVPMTGQAEALRTLADGEAITPLANGDFETMLAANKPAAWYYLRQASIVDGGRPEGKRAILFRNRVEGRNAQALQAIGVDGRQTAEIVVELWVKAHNVAPPKGDNQGARLVVNFFDEQRAPISQESVGPFSGTFEWQRRAARLKVPAKASNAIVAVGMLGVTGELTCDQISVRAVGEPHGPAVSTSHDGRPSITLTSLAVGVIFVSLNPASAYSLRYSLSVRSLPPGMTSMFRSSSLPKLGSLPGGITVSTNSSRPSAPIARRTFVRICRDWSSFQS